MDNAMDLNRQFELIRQSPTVAMGDRVNALKAEGHKIIGLQTGDPDFSTPAAVFEIAQRSIKDGFTHYAPSRGMPEMRRAAAVMYPMILMENCSFRMVVSMPIILPCKPC
jgi:hypothetical protein